MNRHHICVLLLLAAVPTGISMAEEIWEIQGSGLTSPFEGQEVGTSGNVVTAVGSGGFFMQTPAARSDGDPQTSDGIWVVTITPPEVVVGDEVEVVGRVLESHDRTELGEFPTVRVLATGLPMPESVIFDASTPSPTQPWPATELERFEGMRVEIESATVSAPTDQYGDACVTAAGQRLYREPGLAYPGIPGLGVWDGNPEGFELDSDALSLAHTDLSAGAVVSARGCLSFAWGAYQLWPTQLEVIQTPVLPRAVPTRRADELSVATQNLYLFFDDIDNGVGPVYSSADYALRLSKVALQITQVLGGPDVVAVQEAENLRTLLDLADAVAAAAPGISYRAFLIEGNDGFGIDVGFLVRDTVEVLEVFQIGADERFTWDGSLLHDRPPLVMVAEFTGMSPPLEVTLVAVHLRSLGGIEDNQDGPRVRQKRHEQASSLAAWLQTRQEGMPAERLMVLGDFNAFEFSDGYVDVMGQISGRLDPEGALLPASAVVDPPLSNLVLALPQNERYSFVYRCNAETLDHALVNRALWPHFRRLAFARGNADAPRSFYVVSGTALRSSDHDGLVVHLGRPPMRFHRPTGRTSARP